jgi:hypothetical protein
MSLNNSRVANQSSSIHKKSQHKKDKSFQKILKDMNNRVLLSRQAHHTATASKESVNYLARM